MDIRVNSRELYTNKNIKETKIVAFSDAHCRDDKYVKRLYDLIEILKEIHPDIICVPGDFVDTIDDTVNTREQLLDILKQISKISKTIMSFAVHDYCSFNPDGNILIQKYFKDLESIGNSFFPVFPKETKSIELTNNINANAFSLPIDERDYLENSPKLMNLVSPLTNGLSLSNESYNIFLCHSPLPFFNKQGVISKKELQNEDINLIVSGHNHAEFTPKFLEKFNIALFSHGKKFKPHKYSSGLFSNSDEELSVLISRGFLKIPGTIIGELGMIGNMAYSLNNVMKPDIDLLTLKRR